MCLQLLTFCFFTSITFQVICYAYVYKCPKGKLFNENDGKCHETGANFPCLDNLQIYTEKWDKQGFGECTCLPFEDNIIRPLVQSVKDDHCYWLFDKGPCSKGEWLILNKNTTNNGPRKGICNKRKCPENTEVTNPQFWFEHEEKCLQTEAISTEFCGNNEEKVYFSIEKPEPICLEKRPLIITAIGRKIIKRRRERSTTERGCPDGFRKLRNGDCRLIPETDQADNDSSDSDDSSDEEDENHKDNYEGARGQGPYKGALGIGPFEGAAGYGPYKGAAGYGPYKGAAGYGPYEGALGHGKYSG